MEKRTQKNGIKIQEKGVYRTVVGDIVKVITISEENDMLKLFNASEACSQWVSLSRAVRDNKFKERIN